MVTILQLKTSPLTVSPPSTQEVMYSVSPSSEGISISLKLRKGEERIVQAALATPAGMASPGFPVGLHPLRGEPVLDLLEGHQGCQQRHVAQHPQLSKSVPGHV